MTAMEQQIGTLLQIGSFVPVPKGYLSRFWNRDKAAGTKCPSR